MTEAGKTGLRALRVALWGAVLAAGLGVSWFFVAGGGAPRPPSVADQIGQGAYRLTTTSGEPFTQETLRGAPSLVFFGFTHCPDVCPTTLGDIADWQEIAGVEIRTFFITVDPERDTPEALADYVGWLPGAVGVTGTPEALAEALDAFKIIASRRPLEGGDYTMDHSAYVMLFDREGRYNRIFSYQTDSAKAAESLRRIMGG
ncbi:SCO family protein [Neomegalonema sp.]|uniref:SCO family protein n=1 Tax=Neomegalonema sp. TaxID=2039713 RepID=UPI002604C341|nr:SCO family protein [Neomegalonema sp.]MDD2867369.1 SCO family protein [Neomegalonema sp.]